MTEENNKTGNQNSVKIDNNVAKIKVLGIGGAGVNSVNNMIEKGLNGVEFFAANTDAQALGSALAPNKIQLGHQITRGLGAGADPEVGLAAAKESVEDIRKSLEGSDMVFVTAGFGGGTGSYGASVVAEVAREMGCLTVGVVTKPFNFEGRRRMRNADLGIERLRSSVDTMIVIPNQRLLAIAGRNMSLIDTFQKADDILYQAVKGISDLIINEGLVNVDFADVRAVMSEMGMAMMGTGEAQGDSRAVEAAQKAISSPLLEDISIHGARGVLINVTASPDVTLQEVNEAAELIHAEADPDANIIWGMVIDNNLKDTVRVTVIATGFGEPVKDVKSGMFSGLKKAVTATNQLDQPSYTRVTKEAQPSPLTAANTAPVSDVVKLRKLSISMLSGSEDRERDKYEIPPFLRRHVE